MNDLTVAQSFRPTLTRTIVKAATYRFFGFLLTLLGAMLWTSDFKTALSISASDIILKTLYYVAHERIWARIDTGRETP